MIRFDTVIMAHKRRSTFIPDLLAKLDRPAQVVWDRRNDRWDTGRRAWQAIDRTASHGLVLQDDAVIPHDLVAGVELALQHVPAKTPLCLYCGRVQPYRDMVNQLVARTDGNTSWLTMGNLNWGPGIVLPVEWIDDMIAWGDTRPDVANYDKRISRWLGHQGIRTWYPWPSLVDHRDSPSLIPGRTAVRHAHRFIGADASALSQRYDGAVVTIPALLLPEDVLQPVHRGSPPVRFVSVKYPNLDLSNKPGLHGVKFRDGVCEVSRTQAVSILQGPWWQRRGIRLATDADLTPPAAITPAVEQAVEPAPEVEAPAVEPPPSEPEPASHVPDGTVDEVLEWVADDNDRARLALDAEQRRDRPRTSLVTKLGKITEPTDLVVHSSQVGQAATEA